MTDDRELLEQAAKAAGIDLTGAHFNGTFVFWTPRKPNWNPLKDDGDALRLACSIPLMAGFDMQYLFACAWQASESHEERCAYVRRKIVETVARFSGAALSVEEGAKE